MIVVYNVGIESSKGPRNQRLKYPVERAVESFLSWVVHWVPIFSSTIVTYRRNLKILLFCNEIGP